MFRSHTKLGNTPQKALLRFEPVVTVHHARNVVRSRCQLIKQRTIALSKDSRLSPLSTSDKVTDGSEFQISRVEFLCQHGSDAQGFNWNAASDAARRAPITTDKCSLRLYHAVLPASRPAPPFYALQ